MFDDDFLLDEMGKNLTFPTFEIKGVLVNSVNSVQNTFGVYDTEVQEFYFHIKESDWILYQDNLIHLVQFTTEINEIIYTFQLLSSIVSMTGFVKLRVKLIGKENV